MEQWWNFDDHAVPTIDQVENVRDRRLKKQSREDNISDYRFGNY
jgi:hypothetical protein